MFAPRYAFKIISANNEISLYNNCEDNGNESNIGIKEMFKKVDFQYLLRCGQNAFKLADRQTIFRDGKFKPNSQLLNLLINENNNYVDASFVFRVDPSTEDKVNDRIRDVEIEKLCDLNTVFFQLPVNILCDTVALIDRFISKVKVKPKYMSCLTAACFHISATSSGYKKIFLSVDNLANLLRCGASGKDLEHMQQIVQNKLQDYIPLVNIYHFIAEVDPEAASDRQLDRILEGALTKFLICWRKPSRVAIAVLIVYYQKVKPCYSIERLYEMFKSDWDQIVILSLLIAEQYAKFFSTKCNKRGRESLLWIISRKTLSKIQISSVPELETIAEEEDDCYGDN